MSLHVAHVGLMLHGTCATYICWQLGMREACKTTIESRGGAWNHVRMRAVVLVAKELGSRLTTSEPGDEVNCW